MATTLALKTVRTFSRKVHFAIPPENPEVQGYITVDYHTLSKGEVKELLDGELTDEEAFDRVVAGIHGLGAPDTGEELTGQAALEEAKTGALSSFLVPGIVSEYFESYGQARRGNSRRRR